jgi:hypothetical protein
MFSRYFRAVYELVLYESSALRRPPWQTSTNAAYDISITFGYHSILDSGATVIIQKYNVILKSIACWLVVAHLKNVLIRQKDNINYTERLEL